MLDRCKSAFARETNADHPHVKWNTEMVDARQCGFSKACQHRLDMHMSVYPDVEMLGNI